MRENFTKITARVSSPTKENATRKNRKRSKLLYGTFSKPMMSPDRFCFFTKRFSWPFFLSLTWRRDACNTHARNKNNIRDSRHIYMHKDCILLVHYSFATFHRNVQKCLSRGGRPTMVSNETIRIGLQRWFHNYSVATPSIDVEMNFTFVPLHLYSRIILLIAVLFCKRVCRASTRDKPVREFCRDAV